jgi:dihydroxyacetone kinase-like protein
MKRGKVKAGDKSILDIYIPVLNFLQKNSDFQSKKNEINEILSLSLAKTKEMEARVGRAKFLEKKGLGFIDPGAKSTEIILREYFAAIL